MADVPDFCMCIKIVQRKLVSLSTVEIISNLISVPGVEETERDCSFVFCQENSGHKLGVPNFKGAC